MTPEPGRVVVRPLDGDRDWSWYWEAYVGDARINGGVAESYPQGHMRGRDAIAGHRLRVIIEENNRRGTLPSL